MRTQVSIGPLTIFGAALILAGIVVSAQDQHPGDWDRSLRYGYVDGLGRIVISPRFEAAQDFHEGLAAVCLPTTATDPSRSRSRNCGFINHRGTFVVTAVYWSLGSFFEGRAWYAVGDGGPYGYLDHAGVRAITARFTMVSDFREGVAAVAVGTWYLNACRCYGFITRTGEFMIHPRFDQARSFSEGLAAVRTADGWGFVDKNGELAVTPSYDQVGDFSEGLAAFCQGSRCGFIDRHGREQIPARYGPRPGRFSEGVAHVTLDGSNVFVDHQGTIVIGPSGNDASDFSEGLADVYRFVLHGFIDHDGHEILKPAFDYAADFRQGLAAVYVDGKWGYIDRLGRLAIPPRFEDFPGYTAQKGFQEGLAVFAVKPTTSRRPNRPLQPTGR